MSSDILSFTKEDIDRVFPKIWDRELIKNSDFPEPTSHPKAFIWGGPPGAGKSSSMSRISKTYLDDNSLIISGDDYRKYHPNFKKIVQTYNDRWSLQTSKWSSAIFDRVFEKAIERGYNLQIEGTMRSQEVVLNTVDFLSKEGYKVSFAVTLTPKNLCWDSTIERYEKQKVQGMISRAVDREFFDNYFDSFADSIIEIYDKNKDKLFLLLSRDDSTEAKVVYKSSLENIINIDLIKKLVESKIF